MATTIGGVVKDGVIVPDVRLPEGTRVDIILMNSMADLPPEMQEEFQAWEILSNRALERVDRLGDEFADEEARQSAESLPGNADGPNSDKRPKP